MARLVLALALIPAALSAQVRTGAFITRQAGVEITREIYRFDGTTLTADVDIPPRQMRLETQITFTPRLAPLTYHMVARNSASGTTLQDFEATFADSVHWTARGVGGAQRGAGALKRPYALYQNLAFSHLAAVLLRHDRAIRGTQVMDLWLPDGGRTAQLRATFVGDSAQLEMSGIVMHVKTDATGWLRSLSVPAQALTVEWRESLSVASATSAARADTLAPAGVGETAVTFASGNVSLAGTLALPRNPAPRLPVALIVAGSGPTDRNGNSGALRSNMYAQLAWKLAEQGIASLRYDKRGLGSSSQVQPSTLTLDDFAADVTAGVRFLRADRRFGPVVIIGHSEGAWLALRALNGGAEATGVVLLAGVGRGIRDVIVEQLTFQLDSSTAKQFAALFPRYLAGNELGNVPANLQPLLMRVNRRFMQGLAAYDARAEIGKVRTPVLIVQGDQDIQVSVRDAELLKAAKPAAELALLRGANHLFKPVATRDRSVQLTSYMDPALPLVPALPETVARWIRTLREVSRP